MSDQKEIINIKKLTKEMRKNILKMSLAAGASSSHFGGSLSTVELLATLYNSVLKFDVSNPLWEDRDRFILSKGHACLGYYSVLCEKGYFTKEDLNLFEKNGSFLLGHPVINKKKGIEFSNGSLGMGLSLGVGVAIAAKKNKKNYKVFVLIGDGECNEGSVWEAAMAAPNYKLDNLVAIIDNNNFQQTGTNKNIMDLKNLNDKWKSFGWDTIEIDGHNISEIYSSLLKNPDINKPKAIIAKTVKGKGFSFSENNNDWHHSVLSKSFYEKALDELKKNGN